MPATGGPATKDGAQVFVGWIDSISNLSRQEFEWLPNLMPLEQTRTSALPKALVRAEHIPEHGCFKLLNAVALLKGTLDVPIPAQDRDLPVVGRDDIQGAFAMARLYGVPYTNDTHMRYELGLHPLPPNNRVVGFRGWDLKRISGESQLISPHAGDYLRRGLRSRNEVIWKEATKAATCRYCSSSPQSHGHKKTRGGMLAEFACGIYADHRLENVRAKLEWRPVWGAVLAGGRISIHDGGWRAERAQIIGLTVNCPEDEALELAQRLGVNVIRGSSSARMIDLQKMALRSGRVVSKSQARYDPEFCTDPARKAEIYERAAAASLGFQL